MIYVRMRRVESEHNEIYICLHGVFTQVNRMSRSRRMLATGGKQRIFGVGHGLY